VGRRQSRRTVVIIAALAIIALVAVHDLTAVPGHSIAARAAIALIDEYRAHVGPRLGKISRCRFKPSCSRYGRAVIQKHGFIRGSAKTAVRIARCGPWTAAGTVDNP
jgi:putative membrane protein insertion efficiency factor